MKSRCLLIGMGITAAALAVLATGAALSAQDKYSAESAEWARVLRVQGI